MIIPNDLQDVLFFSMGAKYVRDGLKARRNANDGEEQLKRYLGTYFPRSWVEQNRLWKRLLQYSSLLERWKTKDKVRILDIGSGTGGNAHGIVDALKCSPLGLLPLEIHVVDINPHALSLQKQVFDCFMYSHFVWNAHQQQFTLDAEKFGSELGQLISKCEGKFDVILTSKFLNEIATYALDSGNSPLGFFKAFLLEADKAIKPDGLVVIVDVAVKIGHGWVPVIINREWHEARAMGINLSVVLPRACGHYENICRSKQSCFQFTPLEVMHRECMDNAPDITNIVFKVLARSELVQEMLSETGAAPNATIMSEKHNSYCVRGVVLNNPGNFDITSPWT